MERIQSGISGLDEMLKGGIPKNRHVAVYGGPGTGKSSLCFEYIYRGAKMDENGLFITLEEEEEEILANTKEMFNDFKDIDELVKRKKIVVKKPEKLNIESIADMLEKEITEHGSRRAAIDSATLLKLSFKDESEYRQTMFEFFSLLKHLDCTSMLVVEAKTTMKEEMHFEIEHFLMDGIINLYALDRGDRRVKAIEILKMRGTDHSRDLVPYKITPSGIKVYIGEKVF